MRSYPDLDGFFDLVRSYNIRQLSFPEEALPAFTGILSALSRRFLDGFYGGIPVMYFDIALLWKLQMVS